jgi:RHS repeat-associated protein
MSYSYNSYRQLQSETRTFTALPGKSYILSYAYNLADQLKSVNYNITGGASFNKNVNYAYNNVGALSGVGTNLIGTDPNATANVLNTVTFRATGALNRVNYGNERRLTMGYNANRQQPTTMKVDRTDGTDPILDYGYDYYGADGLNNNRIKKITDNVDAAYTVDYKYDNYNRLTKATYGGATAYNYGYDAWGNVTNFNGTTINYAANGSGAPATNRITTAVTGSTTLTHSYDAAGNMTNDGQQTFSYDGANQLKAVGSGGQNTYGYDGDGKRVRKVENGSAPIFYIWSNVLGKIALEVSQSQNVNRAYVYSGNRLFAQQSIDGNFYWMHDDLQGNGRKMTDSGGLVKYRAEFSPFGQTMMDWAASGNPGINSKKFTGYERDAATGLDYAGARMYGSNRGRFPHPDSLGLKAADLRKPESLNRYAYTRNDPVNFVDPNGQLLAFISCVWQNHLTIWDDDGHQIGSYGSYRCSVSIFDFGGGGSGGGGGDEDVDIQTYVGDVIRRKEREGFAKAGEKLKGDCNQFYEKLIQDAAQIAKIEYPNGRPGIRPPLQGAATFVLNLYWDAMQQGRVVNTGLSGTATNRDGTTYIVYGNTLNFSDVLWNNEFYNLSADDRGFHTLHEALHQVAGFTDEILAQAAGGGGPTGNQTASEYFNSILERHCN